MTSEQLVVEPASKQVFPTPHGLAVFWQVDPFGQGAGAVLRHVWPVGHLGRR